MFPSALYKHCAIKTQILQLLHNKLPIEHEQKKWMNTYDSSCQACKSKEETMLLMFQCDHNDYNNWRHSMLRKLLTKCKAIGLVENLKKILFEGIDWDFNEETLDLAEYNLKFHFLIESLNDTGWLNSFEGLWSTQWHTMQEEESADTKKLTDTCAITLTLLMCAEWYKLREIRNGHHHGLEKESKNKRLKEKLAYKMHNLYAKKNKVLAMDCNLFAEELGSHLTKLIFHMKTWIALNEPIIQLSMEAKKKVEKSKDLRTFFTKRKTNQ